MSTSTIRSFKVCFCRLTDQDCSEYVRADMERVICWMEERGIPTLEAEYGCDWLYELKFRSADYMAVKRALVQCLLDGLFTWCQCGKWIYERDHYGRAYEASESMESRRLRFFDTAEKEKVRAGK